MQKDRFDLETAIMQAWHTADDLRMVLETLELENPKEADEVGNLLVGIQALHEARMNNLFTIFEYLVHSRHLQ